MLFDLLILLAAILFIVVSTTKYKLHPFLALLITAFGVGILIGIPLVELPVVVSLGFGKTLQGIGIVIIAGTVIGVFLEKSGATITISKAIIRLVSAKRPIAALNFIGYVVSIPVFCDSAFVILSSLNKSLSRETRTNRVPLAIALSTGLYAPHTLIPPTPGPLAAAANLHLDNLLLVIIAGLLIALPVVAIGQAYAHYLTKKYPYLEGEAEELNVTVETEQKLPSLGLSIAPILVPILLMAMGTTAKLMLDEGGFRSFLEFVGTPVVALLAGMFLSFLLIQKGDENLNNWITDGLKNAAMIIIITGVGGALGAVLQQMPIQEYLSEGLAGKSLGLLLPFLIAAVLKTAQGSSTVAIITTTAILYPLLGSLGLDSDMGKTLVIMATGAGAMTVSHANDSYFWVVTQFTGMDIKTAYRTQTVATLLQGIVGLITVSLAGLILL